MENGENKTENEPEVILGGISGTMSVYKSFSVNDFFTLKCGENPIHLYKYYSNNTDTDGVNYSLDALTNGTIYLRRAREFNDSFDCNIRFDPEIVKLAFADLYIEALGGEKDQKTLEEKCSAIFKLVEKQTFIAVHNRIQACTNIKPQSIRDFMCRIMAYIFAVDGRITKKVFIELLHQQISEYIIDVYPIFIKDIKMYCFSKTNSSQLMWAHYANSHKGFCIEYQLPLVRNDDDFNRLSSWEQKAWVYTLPMAYMRERIDLTDEVCMLLRDIPALEEQFPFYKFGLLAKNMEWQYEQEWRFIYPFTVSEYYPRHVLSERIVHNSDGTETNNMKYFSISAVYLGCKMEPEERDKVIEAASRNAKMNKTKIEIMQGKESKTEYQIIFDKLKTVG